MRMNEHRIRELVLLISKKGEVRCDRIERNITLSVDQGVSLQSVDEMLACALSAMNSALSRGNIPAVNAAECGK
jgi:hypothetical protein